MMTRTTVWIAGDQCTPHHTALVGLDRATTCVLMIGDDACPYNSLYWDFMDRNEVRFAKNPRMSLTMRSWAARNPDDKVAIRARAATIRERLRAGESL